MIVFLIILAVLVLLITAILSVSATFTVIYDGDWSTRVRVLWIDKDIELSKILSFILFPEKKADEIKEKEEAKKAADGEADASEQPKKQNYIIKLWRDEGIAGIMSFASNLFQSASNAVITLFKGFHIYSLYVKIIVGGGDAAQIAEAYGRVCKYYYPLKGIIISGMRVDNYDDMITADFIAPRNEYGLQFIGSVSVATIIKVLFSAGKTFLINMIKNK